MGLECSRETGQRQQPCHQAMLCLLGMVAPVRPLPGPRPFGVLVNSWMPGAGGRWLLWEGAAVGTGPSSQGRGLAPLPTLLTRVTYDSVPTVVGADGGVLEGG